MPKNYGIQHLKIIVLKLFLLFSLFFFMQVKGKAQNDYNFKYYKASDGLSSNWINDIIQDQDGFMWFGTSDGLSKFDGYTFTTYKNSEKGNISLNDNFIAGIKEDRERNCLWIVNSKGVSKFDIYTGNYKNYFICSSSEINYKPGRKGVVYVDSRGNIWVGGLNKKIYKYFLEKDVFLNISTCNFNQLKIV